MQQMQEQFVADQQVTVPVLQKLPGMPATPAGLVVEDEDLGAELQVVAAIRPPGMVEVPRCRSIRDKPIDRLSWFCRCRDPVAKRGLRKNAPAFSALPASLRVVVGMQAIALQ